MLESLLKLNMMICSICFTMEIHCLFLACIHILIPYPVTPRRSSSGSGNNTTDSEFPGQHFQGDLLLLALGASQRDLFEDDWLDVMVRVYWLKARFLALQVKFICLFIFYLIIIELFFSLSNSAFLVLTGGHGIGSGEL